MPQCNRSWLLAAAGISVLLLLSACGGGEEEAADGSPTAQPTTTPGVTADLTPLPSPTAARVIDLATSPPALTIYAADEGDLLNDIPAMAVGDFNGDSVGDLLLGARFADGPDNSRQEAGEAYVIFGSTDLPTSIDIAAEEQDITIYGAKGVEGAQGGDALGFGVAALDINDDGTDDIVVSAPSSEGPDADFRTDRGVVYIIFGGPDLPATIDLAQDPQDVSIIAAEGFSLMGDSMTTGDVNGDGVTDLILGAPFAGREPGSPHGGPRTELGEVYAIFGSKNLASLIRIPERQEDFTVVGSEQYSELGDAVAAGDVNGDGIDDLIVAEEAVDRPDRANVGAAHVIFGDEKLDGLLDLTDDEQDLTIIGRAANDALGFCAASGDVNDDGIDDILVVAQRADGLGGRTTSGEAYLVLGSSGLKGTIDVLKNEQDVTLPGAAAHDLLSSCSAGHDVNGDGIGDILLGSGFASGDITRRDLAGAAYVIFGRADPPTTIDLVSEVDVLVLGRDPGDRLGSAVGAGDINGDGREEILLVAPHTDGPDNARTGAGEIYVITTLQEGG